MSWIDTLALADLPVGRAHVVKHGADSIALFHREEGLFAIDNRCPHEGYPLVQGSICGAVLTCKWHNYKFDLRDGACVLGEEAVRSYPVRVREGRIEVDLAPSPARVAGLFVSLHEGLSAQRMGRVVRDVVRLLDAGVPAARLALEGALHDARHGEYGLSHGPAVAAEILEDLADSDVAPLALGQALDVTARNNIRRPVRPVPEALEGGDEDRFLAAVEAEDAALAEGLIRGAVRAGKRLELRQWMLGVCAAHFLDFGHQLIYTHALISLLEANAWEGAEDLLGTWAFGSVGGTREDLLPGWAAWRARAMVAATSAELDREALIGANGKEAAAALAHTDESVLAALSIAAAERMLRFDLAHDANPEVQEAWLDVSHRLTVVEATRRALAVGGDRRLLSQAAQFVAMARPLDGARAEIPALPADLDGLAAAVRAHDAPRALGHAAALWAADRAGLGRTLRALAREDVHDRSIFVAHDIKTIGTGLRESALLDDPRPMLAAVRLLASPSQERALRRLVGEAVQLVRHGRPPTTLT